MSETFQHVHGVGQVETDATRRGVSDQHLCPIPLTPCSPCPPATTQHPFPPPRIRIHLRTVPSGRARAGRPDFGTVDRGTFRAMNALPEAMDSARRTGMRDRLAPKPLAGRKPAARFCSWRWATCDGLGEVKSGVYDEKERQTRNLDPSWRATPNSGAVFCAVVLFPETE